MPVDRRHFLLASGLGVGVAMAATPSVTARAEKLRVIDLKVDYVDRPLGLESLTPRLSWRTESTRRNVQQSAYQILVATSEAAVERGVGDLWDSGRVSSRQSACIEYRGQTLHSRQRCWWCVRVWDNAQEVSDFSDASWWEMGLITPRDWSANWLSAELPASQSDREYGLHWVWNPSARDTSSSKFRFTFTLPEPTNQGALLVVPHGPTKIVGASIDAAQLSGSATDTPEIEWMELPPLAAGKHAVAIEVSAVAASGLVASEPQLPCCIALLARLQLQSGETLRFGSPAAWKVANEVDTHWLNPAFDDTTWSDVMPVAVSAYQPWPAEPALYLRRAFSVDQSLQNARLYITALGAYEARLNGQRIGDAQLTPEPSQYAKRALYRAFDVTSQVRSGANVLGLTVADGWYASFNSFRGRYTWGPPPRRVLAQLELTLADGSCMMITTGPGWKIADGPIRRSEIRVGEVYDGRFERTGWDFPTYDDAQWLPAETAAPAPCRLVAQISPPIRAMRTLAPKAFSQTKPGTFVFDFGEHFSGWCRLRTKGVKGSEIELRFAELLGPSGEIEQHWLSIGEPKCDRFILAGHPSQETFEPRFTYRGFRYVQITGLKTPPTLDSVEGIAITSDLVVTGQLRCDSPLIEGIWRNTFRSQQSNFVGIPTDCPSREQLGYLADAGAFWDAAAFNMDVCAFTSRHLDNAADDQGSDGAFPIATPLPVYDNAFFRTTGSPPGWGDGAIILAWVAWQRYGNVSIIERHWEAMSRHIQFIRHANPDFLWKHKRSHDFGDWFSVDQVTIPNETSAQRREAIATAYWAHSTTLLAEMSTAIGRVQDAQDLRVLTDHIRQAFQHAYVQPDGTIADGSQVCYVLALKFGLLPQASRLQCAQRLADDIRNKGIALSTGFLGTQFILDVLVDAGFTNLAYGLLLRTQYPSWGFMILNGATTIWENWSGEIRLNNVAYKLSRNHYSLGAICGFLFRRMAGIEASSPGFSTIAIRPALDARVHRAGADYDSIKGRISTDWSLSPEGRVSLSVSIPPNTTAQVHLPARRHSIVYEGRTEVWRRTDMRIEAQSDQEIVIEIGSGSYRFVVID